MEDTTSTITDTSTAASSTTATSGDTTAQTASAEPAAPRSFGEAIERLKAEDGATTTEGDPATTAQASDATVAKDTTTSKQTVPPEKHWPTILDNARKKATEDARPTIEAEVKQRYAWADRIEEPDREELTALYHGLKTDLIGTLTGLIERASEHPDHAKALRSQAARLLNAARRVQGDSATDNDEPQPDIPLEDGRAVYSAEQQRKRDAWLIKQVSAQFDQKLQPFQQDREKAQQQAQLHELHTKAADVLKRYADKPHFTEHKADILALMNANPDMTLGDAYAEVLATKVLPTASQKERAAVLADIHHKAGAGTLNPQTTTTGTPIKPDGKFSVDRVRTFFEASA